MRGATARAARNAAGAGASGWAPAVTRLLLSQSGSRARADEQPHGKLPPHSATMPDKAVAVTRSWFETSNRGDLDAFIELYSADAEMTPPVVGATGTSEGRPAIRRFFEGLREFWDGQDEAVLRELFRAGDSIVSAWTGGSVTV